MHQVASLIRRGVENMDGDVYQLPSWVFLVVLANIVVFFPVFIYLNYTLGQIFPVLAIVENENPPAYEPVALNEDAEQQNPAGAKVDGTPITASLRATGRLLSSTGGFFAKFRGITVWVAFQIAATILTSILGGFHPLVFAPIAVLLANLATVQLETAWVHIVMSHPTETSNWKRFPTFKRAFDATWKPIVIFWLASQSAALIPLFVADALHFKSNFDAIDDKGNHGVKVDGGDSWKGAIVVLTGFALAMGVVLPAKILLVRIQASLLPESDDPIVPFDRSFQGQVEPAVVTGKGYATIRIAWSTITTAAWRRIIMLQFKVLLVNVAAILLMAAIAVPQLIWIMSIAEKKEKHD